MAISRVASGLLDLTFSTSLTKAFNAGSPSSGVLFVFAFGGFSAPATHTCTYNGVSMTEFTGSPGVDASLQDRYGLGWFLYGPAAGTNNIVITLDGSTGAIAGWAVAYDGVDQGGLDAQTTMISASAATSITRSLTVSANAITVAGGRVHQNAPTAGTGSTLLSDSTAAGAWAAESSTFPIVGGGSYSMTMTGGGSAVEWAAFMGAVKPTGGVATIPNRALDVNQAIVRASVW